VITFSRSSAQFIQREYGVPAEKLRVVVPGANIEEELVESHCVPNRAERGTFVVGFVGMDYIRKRLLPLADAVMALRQRGLLIELRVVGPSPRELQNVPGIQLLGRINKAYQMERYVEILKGCDLGALLSSAEALGFSILEFLRMGIPVLATDVNGIPDAVDEQVGVLMPRDFAQSELCERLAALASRGKEYELLKHAAWRRRHFASWSRAMTEFARAMELATPRLA
jgi:glycosyltransferase involved in cell wall biosynthesis